MTSSGSARIFPTGGMFPDVEEAREFIYSILLLYSFLYSTFPVGVAEWLRHRATNPRS